MAAQPLDDAAAGPNEQELARETCRLVKQRQHEDCEAHHQHGERFVFRSIKRSQPAHTGRRRVLEKHRIHQPLDGPGLQQFESSRDDEH